MHRLLALFLVAAVGAGCRPRKSHVEAIDARAIYERTCAICHGRGGQGDTPAGRASGAHDLTSPELQRRPDAALAHQIVVGSGKMPAFGSVLDDREVEALVAYLRTLAPPTGGAPR